MLVLGLAGACSPRARDDGPCRGPFASRPELDAALIEQLAASPRAAAIERETRATRVICRGPITDGAVTPDGLVLLPADDRPGEAARLAHLLTHVRDGVAARGDAPEACLARALEREAAAWTVEFEVRARLELAPMSAFEAELRASAPSRWPAQVQRWLERDEGPTWRVSHYASMCGGR